MKTGFAMLLAGTVMLASCGEQSAPAPAENAAVAEATNAADATLTPVDNVTDMADPGNTADASPARTIAYDCKPAMALAVSYDNAATPDGSARVTLEGKDYVMEHVMSGSGARYLTKQGRSAGASLVWWNKGRDGLLLEGKADDPAAEEKTIATCSERG